MDPPQTEDTLPQLPCPVYSSESGVSLFHARAKSKKARGVLLEAKFLSPGFVLLSLIVK